MYFSEKDLEDIKVYLQTKTKSSRLENLAPGQVIYQSMVYGHLDVEYYKLIVQEVNIEEGFIIAKTMNNNIVEVKTFDTIDELKQQGIELNDFE